jgi:hypothetical protein
VVVRVAATDFFADREAIAAGHVHVEQHEIGAAFREGGQPPLAVFGLQHLEPHRLQRVARHLADGGRVIDDQDLAPLLKL